MVIVHVVILNVTTLFERKYAFINVDPNVVVVVGIQYKFHRLEPLVTNFAMQT